MSDVSCGAAAQQATVFICVYSRPFVVQLNGSVSAERFRREGIRARQNRCKTNGSTTNPRESEPHRLVPGESATARGQGCPPYGPIRGGTRIPTAARKFHDTVKPVVSILIPAYNAQKWIAETIQSALAQTWERKEIIVVDDGSTDQTLAIARQFSSRGVAVTTQKNAGAAAARNQAFKLCKGDYIQWLDADDLLSPDKIARQIEKAEHDGSRRLLLSSGWGTFYYRLRKANVSRSPLWCDLLPAEWLFRKMGQNIHMQTATWLVSRELTEAAGPWDTRLLGDDDGEYFARVLMASAGTRFVAGPTVYYRVSGHGRLSYIGKSDRKMRALFLSMQLHIKYLLSLDDSPRTQAACMTYLRNWLPSFYPERLDILTEAREMAAMLGQPLEIPEISWKYAWIEALCGRQAAKQTQMFYNRRKIDVEKLWDRVMFNLERQKQSRPSPRLR